MHLMARVFGLSNHQLEDPKDLSALAASDKVVVVALVNSNLAGLNASTGKLLWSGGTYGANSDPIMAGGLVYFSSIDRHLYALNEETGTIAWHYDFNISPNISINLGCSKWSRWNM